MLMTLSLPEARTRTLPSVLLPTCLWCEEAPCRLHTSKLIQVLTLSRWAHNPPIVHHSINEASTPDVQQKHGSSPHLIQDQVEEEVSSY
jgi:hypothetical protein